MNKKVIDLLEYLECESDIKVDYSTISKTQKIVNSINQRLKVNVVAINDGSFALAIVRCGEKCDDCDNCSNIFAGLEVLYNSPSLKKNAKDIKHKITKVFPTMQIEIRKYNSN